MRERSRAWGVDVGHYGSASTLRWQSCKRWLLLIFKEFSFGVVKSSVVISASWI